MVVVAITARLRAGLSSRLDTCVFALSTRRTILLYTPTVSSVSGFSQCSNHLQLLIVVFESRDTANIPGYVFWGLEECACVPQLLVLP